VARCGAADDALVRDALPGDGPPWDAVRAGRISRWPAPVRVAFAAGRAPRDLAHPMGSAPSAAPVKGAETSRDVNYV
jgi:hypothetical protein